MKKRGYIYYELSEEEREELAELIYKLKSSCENFCLYFDDEFNRLLEIIDSVEEV